MSWARWYSLPLEKRHLPDRTHSLRQQKQASYYSLEALTIAAITAGHIVEAICLGVIPPIAPLVTFGTTITSRVLIKGVMKRWSSEEEIVQRNKLLVSLIEKISRLWCQITVFTNALIAALICYGVILASVFTGFCPGCSKQRWTYVLPQNLQKIKKTRPEQIRRATTQKS